MQKLFKSAILTLALILSVACLAFGVACNKDGDNGDEDTVTSYLFTVVYDDTDKPVNGQTDGYNKYDPDKTTIEIQFCLLLANGEKSTCYDPVSVGADGKAEIKPESLVALKSGEKYVLQMNNLPEGYDYDHNLTFTDPAKITVKITKAN